MYTKHMNEKEKDENLKEGVVLEMLPNAMFKVEIDGQEQLAYLAGKMRIHRIKVLVGDKVLVKTDPYGGKGRIVRRI